MSKISRIFRKITSNPFEIFSYINKAGFLKGLSDEAFVKIMFRTKFGRKLNLENPEMFSEKLQWLKLYNRRPEYTDLVDKLNVRNFIKEKIGEEYLIPLIGAWDSPDEIDFDALPDKFVLKCNHNSGTGMCICRDRSTLDTEKVRKELRKGLAEDYYIFTREWPYKNVKRKIICEVFMEDSGTSELRDYKFFCFNGIPRFLLVISDREKEGEKTKVDFCGMDGKHLPVKSDVFEISETDPELPSEFEKMKELAVTLSQGIEFVRVDFYQVNGRVYFGEMTLFPLSGFVPYTPEAFDYQMGSWLELPEKFIE